MVLARSSCPHHLDGSAGQEDPCSDPDSELHPCAAIELRRHDFCKTPLLDLNLGEHQPDLLYLLRTFP